MVFQKFVLRASEKEMVLIALTKGFLIADKDQPLILLGIYFATCLLANSLDRRH